MRAVQKFSDEYLKRCREMSPDEIARFLDDFRGAEVFDEQQIERFVQALSPGDPPAGQRFLGEAFTN